VPWLTTLLTKEKLQDEQRALFLSNSDAILKKPPQSRLD
jgi:hypothetical protein